MRPTPAKIAAHTPPPAQQLLANLDTCANAPLVHGDIVALAHALEEHDYLPVAPPWSSARRTAVWANHGLLELDGDRLVPTQRAFDAIAAWVERSVDPSRTHGEPWSPIVNGKANKSDLVPHPGNPTIAVAHAVAQIKRPSAFTTDRVGLAAVSSTGRWSMINFKVRSPRDTRAAQARTDHALRAIMYGADLHHGPCRILTADPTVPSVLDRWRQGASVRSSQASVSANASTIALDIDDVRDAITDRRTATVRTIDEPSGHPLYEMALSLAQAAADGSEKQKATGRPWSDVAPDMASSAARAWVNYRP